MWKSIKQHPWRLELVPAVAFAWVLWMAYAFYRQELHSAIVPLTTGQVRRDLSQTAVWQLGLGLTLWLFSVGINSRWVRSEHGKRYNWLVLVLHPMIIMRVLIAYGFLSLIYTNWFDPPIFLRLDLFAGGILLCTGTTAVLEWTRRSIPRDETPEPPPPSVPAVADEGLRYRETYIDWWPVAASASLLATFAVLFVLRLPIAFLATGLPLCALFVCFGFRTVSITTLALKVWFCLIPKRFPISQIESCKVAQHELFRRRRGKRSRAWAITDGRCVELTLKNGKVHRIGAIRPSYICDLLALQGVTRTEAPHGA